MKRKNPLASKKAYSPHYAEKKPFFSEKEIIFRSEGRAKVFQISSRARLFSYALSALSAYGVFIHTIYIISLTA